MASLEKRFHELHNQFVSEVTTDGKVTAYMMLQALTMLPIVLKAEYNESVQQKLPVLEVATSLQGLCLWHNPLFAFIDHPSSLNHLVSQFGSEVLKKDTESYENDIIFMRRTTVTELMDHWPGQQLSDFVTLRVKFDGNPQNYTRQKLNDFRRKFVCELRLSDFIFTLIGSERSNSFVAMWAVYSIVMKTAIKLRINCFSMRVCCRYM